jgi:hypothetical protein
LGLFLHPRKAEGGKYELGNQYDYATDPSNLNLSPTATLVVESAWR